MTIYEFLKQSDLEYDREMLMNMQNERENYNNIIYEGSLPDCAFVRANDIFRLVDECKMKLLSEGKYIDANGGLSFLDKFAQSIIRSFYDQLDK